MGSIVQNILKLREDIPAHVKLIAVSKTKPVSDLLEAYNAGQRMFGENKAQELINKQPLLAADIQWHFIGHMQTNKVKYIAPFVNIIESVDSLKLVKEINKQALKNDRVIDCLIQFHIASEETKYGLSSDETEALLNSEVFGAMKNIRITGIMGMATFTNDKVQIRQEFRSLKNYFDYLKGKYFKEVDSFKEISMGMSADYKIAIEEGSTMVRVGSAIFGERIYN